MYYPAFGSAAALHLAEKYQCEWIQNVVSPTQPNPNEQEMISNLDEHHSRIVHRHQTIGDEDEFYLSPQTLVPSYSCPQIDRIVEHEPIRERSYSLTALDAYARLDITRETLEQMWLSLLDLAFSDKDDFELGEYKLRHIMGLSNSYSHMNETIVEKSRSHGDIFTSSTNKMSKLMAKKSKSFDVTSLPKSTMTGTSSHDAANVGLLQGAAISEPFVDRLPPTSIQSDTEVGNLIDMDNDESIQSFEHDDQGEPEEQYSPTQQQSPSPVIKEPLNYIFNFSHQSSSNDDFDFDPVDDLSDYLNNAHSIMTTNHFGEEDKQVCMSLGFDDDEATAAQEAAVAANVRTRDVYAELATFRPHSLSTIPSSRASQYESSVDDSDEVAEHQSRRNTLSIDQEEFGQLGPSEDDDHDDRGQCASNLSSPQSRPLSSIQSPTRTPPEIKHVSNICIRIALKPHTHGKSLSRDEVTVYLFSSSKLFHLTHLSC